MSQNQKKEKKQIYFKIVAFYIDAIFRGLISFVIVGIGGFILFKGFMKLSTVFTFIIVFFLAIIISPLFSKVKIGEKIIRNYEKWLEKTFKL